MIKNYEYEFGTEIKFIFQDNISFEGYMIITVYFNEYIIKTSDQKFWKCIDCLGENSNYYYEFGRLNFYIPGSNIGSEGQNYIFIFEINDFNETEFSIFDVNNEYFSFTDRTYFNINLYNSEREVELINFNNTDNFYITENNTFPIDLSKYKFQISYINENEFKGQLKALDFENEEIKLNNNSQFKVSNNMGIRYYLDEKEIEEKEVNISLRIKAFNYPYLDSPYSKQVANETEFYFIIKLYENTEQISEENTEENTDENTIENTDKSKDEITDVYKYINTEECPINKFFLNSEKKCVDNCYSYPPFIYIYKDECVENCPLGSIPTKNHICFQEDIYELYEDCPKQYPYILLENKKCIKNCNPIDFFHKICKIQNDMPETINEIINNIKKSILGGSINSLISNDFSGLILNENNITYSITKINEQYMSNYNNISIVQFGECETILRDIYKIDANDSLVLFKLDIFEEGLLIPIVEYEVYDIKNNRKLDLNYCNTTNIDILLYVDSIEENKLFKYDTSSDYYNDICFTYTTEKKTDIILKDRRDEFIKKNLSLCEKNCEYKGYNITTKRAICNCNVKNEMSLFSDIINNKELLLNNFLAIKTLTNIGVIECSKLLSIQKYIKYNIGFYLMLFIILNYIILFFYFLFKGFKALMDKIK